MNTEQKHDLTGIGYLTVWVFFCIAIWPLPIVHFLVALVCGQLLLYIGKKSGETPS